MGLVSLLVKPVDAAQTNLISRVRLTHDEQARIWVDGFDFAFHVVAVVLGVGPFPNLIVELSQSRKACPP
jgi:hypothetical protein